MCQKIVIYLLFYLLQKIQLLWSWIQINQIQGLETIVSKTRQSIPSSSTYPSSSSYLLLRISMLWSMMMYIIQKRHQKQLCLIPHYWSPMSCKVFANILGHHRKWRHSLACMTDASFAKKQRADGARPRKAPSDRPGFRCLADYSDYVATWESLSFPPVRSLLCRRAFVSLVAHCINTVFSFLFFSFFLIFILQLNCTIYRQLVISRLSYEERAPNAEWMSTCYLTLSVAVRSDKITR